MMAKKKKPQEGAVETHVFSGNDPRYKEWEKEYLRRVKEATEDFKKKEWEAIEKHRRERGSGPQRYKLAS